MVLLELYGWATFSSAKLSDHVSERGVAVPVRRALHYISPEWDVHFERLHPT
jgi:hypothetical protein